MVFGLSGTICTLEKAKNVHQSYSFSQKYFFNSLLEIKNSNVFNPSIQLNMLKLMDKINLLAEKGNIIWEMVEIKDCLAKQSQYCLYYNLPLKLFYTYFSFLILSFQQNFSTTDRLYICFCSICLSVLHRLK